MIDGFRARWAAIRAAYTTRKEPPMTRDSKRTEQTTEEVTETTTEEVTEPTPEGNQSAAAGRVRDPDADGERQDDDATESSDPATHPDDGTDDGERRRDDSE